MTPQTKHQWAINNNFIGYGAAFPTIQRWLSIQGDPTLRRVVTYPFIITGTTHIGNTITLNWQRGVHVSEHYIYRSVSAVGPFTNLLTPMALTVNTFTTTASVTETYYMVRAAKLTANGLCTYTNLSQGLFGNVH